MRPGMRGAVERSASPIAVRLPTSEPRNTVRRTPDRAAGGTPREINPLNPRYRLQVAAWKKLPLWAANRLGPWISKGLG